jgi:hypothetical protein
MSLLGQFRDLDAPGHFVWMRGFESMAARKAALEGFYGGPVWQAHREAANATLADNDDVLLLKPPVAAARLDLPPRRPPGTDLGPASLIGVTIQALDGPPSPTSPPGSRPRSVPPWRRPARRSLGWMVTEPAENTFPRLPVREGERCWSGSAASPTPRPMPTTWSAPSGRGWATASAWCRSAA